MAHLPPALWLVVRGLVRVPSYLLLVVVAIRCAAGLAYSAIDRPSVRRDSSRFLEQSCPANALLRERHWEHGPPHDALAQEFLPRARALLQAGIVAKASAGSSKVCDYVLTRRGADCAPMSGRQQLVQFSCVSGALSVRLNLRTEAQVG